MAERMDVRLKEFIRENMPKLKEETICNDNLLDRLISCGVFTTYDKEEIKSERTPDSQKSEFYTKLTQKSQESYTKTIETLKASGQGTAAGILEEGLQGNCPMSNKRRKVETPVWFEVESVVESFAGRENELEELHKLATKQPTNQPSVINQTSTVAGLGGIGKSELAKQYAWTYSKDFDGNAIWINSETRESFRDSLTRLHEEYFSATKLKSGSDAELVQMIYDHFSSRNKKCLIILDNVEEEFDVLKLLPKYVHASHPIIPKVLITSRKTIWKDGVSVFNLNVLNIDDAIKLLERCSRLIGQVVESEDIKTLAEALQCLPLALQQATAYIRAELNQDPSPMKKYLELFEESETCRALLDYKDDGLSDHEKTTLRTWAITLESIEKKTNGPLAIKIMSVLTLYGPENIRASAVGGSKLTSKTSSIRTYSYYYSSPPETVFNGIDYSSDCADKAIALLKTYSMISGKVGWINVHRLVQLVVKLNIQGKITTVLEDALKLLLNSLVDQKAFPKYMIPYAKLIWREALGYDDVIKQNSDFLSLICQSLDRVDRVTKMLLRDSITKLDHILGRKNSITIRLKYYYAKSLSTVKHNRREVLKVVEEIKSLATSTFGKTHDLTENILELVFRFKEKEKLHEEAFVAVEELEMIRAQKYVPTHEIALKTLLLKVSVLTNLDKVNEVKITLTELMRRVDLARVVCDRIDYPIIRIVYGLTKKKMFEAAGQLIRKFVEAEVNVQNANNWMQKTTKTIADDSLRMGKLGEAVELLHTRLEECTRVEGAEHWSTLNATKDLTDVLLKKGDLDEAVELLRTRLEVQRRLKDAEYYQTLFAMRDLADALLKKGDLDEAVELFRTRLEVHEKVEGEQHDWTTLAMKDLAGALLKKGELVEAVELLRTRLLRRLKGEENWTTVEAMKDLADALLLVEKGEDEALSLYKSAHDMLSKINPLSGVNSFHVPDLRKHIIKSKAKIRWIKLRKHVLVNPAPPEMCRAAHFDFKIRPRVQIASGTILEQAILRIIKKFPNR